MDSWNKKIPLNNAKQSVKRVKIIDPEKQQNENKVKMQLVKNPELQNQMNAHRNAILEQVLGQSRIEYLQGESLQSIYENIKTKEVKNSQTIEMPLKRRFQHIKLNTVGGIPLNLLKLPLKEYSRIFQRPKIQGLYEARFTDRIDIRRREIDELILRNSQKAFYTSVVERSQALLKYSGKRKNTDTNKMCIDYAKPTREEKEAEDPLENKRMRCLMTEDEAGYRELIDQKKNKRLAFLLAQTDEYITDLMKMVKKHKHEKINGKSSKNNTILNKRKYALLFSGEYVNMSPECMAANERVTVINKDNSMLKGCQAPKLKNLHQWLTKNPGWTWDTSEAVWDEVEEHTEQDDGALVQNDNRSRDESYYGVAHSIKEPITQQPSIMINGRLKNYQIKGMEWLVSLYNNNLNGILADEMGLGKTIQAIALITYLIEFKKLMGPYLIVVPLSTLSNWQIEFHTWAPSVLVMSYKGSILKRREMQVMLRQLNFNVMLTTYEYVIKDKVILCKLPWKYIIIDEGHRMKNHHCKLTHVLNTFYHRTAHRLLLTGTPLQNKLPELWALLNFLLPDIFKSCASFEQWFNAPFATAGERVELNEEETVLIIRRLHKALRPFLLRRLKKEVELQLPDKLEFIVNCDMSSLQRALYKHMQTNGVLLTDGSEHGRRGEGGAQALMNTIVHLRKICNHPFIFPHVEQSFGEHKKEVVTAIDVFRVSGKFELLDRILPKFKATNHRVLLFCQMTQCLSILEDFLIYRNFQYLRLDGTTKAEDRGELLSKFNDPNSNYFLFLLSTRAGGLGLNLQTADTVILFDSDWNPHQDLQAQDRAHRIGQSSEVRVFRLITVKSIEERILAAARYKLNMDEKVIQAGMFDQQSTDRDRRQFLKSILNQNITDDDDSEIPNNFALNKMLARNDSEFKLFDKMDYEQIEMDKIELKGRTRLITDEELPLWVTNNESGAKVKPDEPMFLERSSRSRKKINYQDNDTESYCIKKKPHKTKKVDDKPTKEIKSRLRNTTNSNLKKLMDDILKQIVEYKNENDRVLAEMFMKLPTKRQLPHYYKVIKNPIDIKKMQNKIDDNSYRDVDELEKDFMLMCSNAQEYNEDDSILFLDSIALQKIFVDIRKRLTNTPKVAHNVKNSVKKRCVAK